MPIHQETAAALVDEVTALVRSVKALGHRAPSSRSRAQLGVLALLAARGECRQNELAQLLGVGPSVISRQLAELHQGGLVDRRPDPDDGRASMVSVSPTGTAVLAEAAEERAATLRELLADWDEEEARASIAVLRRLISRLERSRTEIPRGRRRPDHDHPGAPAPRPLEDARP